MSKISVIVPNYNHAPYLQQRIESILNQTYQDFELIILDDCSTDNSKEIIEQYRNHPKVSQIIYNTENSGSTFKQWNKGIELAKREYVWIAESDDWCEPTFIETLISKLESNKSVVLAYAQSYFIVDNEIKWISKQDYLENFVKGQGFVKNYLLLGNAVFNASMAIFRKEVFREIDKEYMNFKFCGDRLFWGLIAVHGEVFISGKILNYFRNHTGDVSTKAYNSGLNFYEDVKVINFFYEKDFIDILEFKSALHNKYIDFIQKKKLLPQNVVDELQEGFEYHISEIIHPLPPSIFVVFQRKLKNILRGCKKIIKQEFL